MKAAVSTACLYPKPTEDALYDLCLSGISTVEIFVNAPSECSPVFVGDLAAMLRRFGVTCVSVHPWTATQEGFMLFSDYPRRCKDFIEDTKRVFQMMQTLGARYYVLHGASAVYGVPTDIYCERFAMLSAVGKQFGVCVTQENVVKHESQSLKFLREFCRILGDDACLTLDVKQTVRAGTDISELVRTVGDHVVHVHMSDHGERGDCLRIGKGRFQIAPFLRSLKERGFDGAVTLELYRGAFGDVSELAEDYHRIERLIKRAESDTV